MVGIEEDRTFHVVRRLVGKSGRNMKRIEAASGGVSVCLAGRRSAQQDASDGPLEVRVSAVTRASFDAAVQSVRALLQRVHEEYDEFCLANGHPRAARISAVEIDHDA